MHPSDFKDGEHVLVKGEFPLTVKCVTSLSIPHFVVNHDASSDTMTPGVFLKML